MPDSEKKISDKIRLELSRRYGMPIFTNPSGTGWLGRFMRKDGDSIVLLGARPISFGLMPGSPDLVGWKPIVIQPEDVGKKVAVFVGIEVKALHGRFRAEQIRFLERLEQDGALCGVARSVEDAVTIIERIERARK